MIIAASHCNMPCSSLIAGINCLFSICFSVLASIFPALSPDSKYVLRKRKRAKAVSSCTSSYKFALAEKSEFLRSKLDGSSICSSSRVLSSKFNFDFASLRFLFCPEEKLINQPLHVALKASQTVAILGIEYKLI